MTEAIEKQSLKSYYEKCNSQIEEIVQLIQTDLETGNRITVEALIVIDVHSTIKNTGGFEFIFQIL